ncbi:MAG: hypothetical protein ACTHNQ_03805 [Microbacterium sp.]|uniref:hypothetical protein n=1 Tax=Microbacterium sp. TaxID=51671 RepID=UPI003F808B16
MAATELRFATPPVRAVELTIFFDAVPLKLVSLTPLVSSLQTKFPHVSERFARMPWINEDAPNTAPAFLEEESERFPFPWLTFKDDQGRAVSFQDDRLLLRWEFETGREYPGFVALRADLGREFQSFVTHAEESTGGSVIVQRVRAEYENSIPERAAWTAAQQSFSVETDAPITPVPGLQAVNSGGLFHFTDDSYVTHVEYAAFSDATDGSLSLRSTTHGDDAVAAFDALDVAHSRLIECFATLTTKEQQEAWGPR